ncbi:MAG: 3'(2'),5'-bisphosphate nucleotidase CysQ [Rhodospirillales bacterium]|nr:3'(2'),5'-bisphosphate nucleotidase CysQ [Rhodospirillales bacterium]
MNDLLESLIATALEAGRAAMAVYQSDFAVSHKDDRSPVTAADVAAERIILAALARLTPDLPVIAEEATAGGQKPDFGRGRFWLVDPLDGTKEFVARSGQFTVNIGLVEQGRPVLGVVHAPAVAETFAGGPQGAFRVGTDGQRQPIACRLPPPEGLTVLSSRSHGDPLRLDKYLAGRKVAALSRSGSSLKFCRVAEGAADLYPRFGPTSEWDTAAGHAILVAAGGSVETLDGQPLGYGKPSLVNPDFVAWGKR